VQCDKSWYVQLTDHERRLKVWFLNQKELPVTVRDMRVVYYKGAQPLKEEEHPHVQFVNENGEWRSLSSVHLPSREPVEQIISVTLGAVLSGSPSSPDPVKKRAVKEANEAVFEAKILGARDRKKKLTPTW